MKITNTILILAILAGCSPQEDKEQQESQSGMENTNSIAQPGSDFDANLAKKLNADDYGMKTYIFALLKSGPNRDQDSTTAAEIQRAHLDNINRMAEEGDLVVVGPFLTGGDYRGIYVFNVETIEEAEELTKTDPAVQAGRLTFEFYPWYSSATLQLVNEWHKKVARENP